MGPWKLDTTKLAEVFKSYKATDLNMMIPDNNIEITASNVAKSLTARLTDVVEASVPQ